MRSAERVAKVVGPPFAGEVECRQSKTQIDPRAAQQALDHREVEHLSRLYTPSLEIDKFRAWPRPQLVEFFSIDFQRRSAFISTRERQ